MGLGDPEELPVLGKVAVSGSVWLIDGFRLRNRIAPWLVAALVDQAVPSSLQTVLVGAPDLTMMSSTE